MTIEERVKVTNDLWGLLQAGQAEKAAQLLLNFIRIGYHVDALLLMGNIVPCGTLESENQADALWHAIERLDSETDLV